MAYENKEFKSAQDFKNYITQALLSGAKKLSDAEIDQWELNELRRQRYEKFIKTVPERYKSESIHTFKTETEEQKNMLEVTKHFIESVNSGKFATLIF